jgi:hypothetical protein
MKINIIIKSFVCLVIIFFFSYPALISQAAPTAANSLDRLKNVASFGGYEAATETSAAGIVGTVIKAFLGVLGLIFIILIVLAGYNWMTAAGDEQKVEKAKEEIRRAIIGLIIIVGSYSIWAFVLEKLIKK